MIKISSITAAVALLASAASAADLCPQTAQGGQGFAVTFFKPVARLTTVAIDKNGQSVGEKPKADQGKGRFLQQSLPNGGSLTYWAPQ
jgi:hypothetical protein